MKIVMYAKYPESIRMMDCPYSRHVLNKESQVEVLPMMCHKGTGCRCIMTQEKAGKRGCHNPKTAGK